MKELSVGEQRYQAVMAVVSGGRTVTEVAGLGREPANDACVAGSLRARGHGGDGQPVAPAEPLPPPDAGPRRGAGSGDAAPQAVLGPASTGPGVGQERRDPDAVGLSDLSLPAPG